MAEPPVAGWRLTLVLAGRIVPVGKPEPRTLTIVTPDWPAGGVVVALKVTVA
jgi:hypothetical protein